MVAIAGRAICADFLMLNIEMLSAKNTYQSSTAKPIKTHSELTVIFPKKDRDNCDCPKSRDKKNIWRT